MRKKHCSKCGGTGDQPLTRAQQETFDIFHNGDALTAGEVESRMGELSRTYNRCTIHNRLKRLVSLGYLKRTYPAGSGVLHFSRK